ncbi:glycine cleavage system protein R [Gammaproteobacteria bacterium AH-315-M22]|nr:glycine cleavage system protein R [Gammaproteobacteria bacterium AH-315-M22]
MQNYLIISAIGHDKPGIVQKISKIVLDNGCSVEDSRMMVLGGEFSVIMMTSGNWNHIAKLENAVKAAAAELDLAVTLTRTEPRETKPTLMPYAVEVVAIDHPGIVHHVTDFFSRRQINIEDLSTDSYHAAHTGTAMFSMNIAIDVPSQLSLSELRMQFLSFCDEYNLDAVIEPIKK